MSESKRFELSFAHFVKIYKKLPRTLFVSSLPLSKFIETRAGWRWCKQCVLKFLQTSQKISHRSCWCWPVAGSEQPQRCGRYRFYLRAAGRQLQQHSPQPSNSLPQIEFPDFDIRTLSLNYNACCLSTEPSKTYSLASKDT